MGKIPISTEAEELILYCPNCGLQHIDRDEWATKRHRTHLCERCRWTWQPKIYATVGVGSK